VGWPLGAGGTWLSPSLPSNTVRLVLVAGGSVHPLGAIVWWSDGSVRLLGVITWWPSGIVCPGRRGSGTGW
jgi:hypothetical protein